MRDDQIPRVKKRAASIEKAFDDLLKFLGKTADKNGRAFDISRPIPTTDSSISDLRARTAVVEGLTRKFDEKGGALTPLTDFVSLVNAGNAVTNAITQITDVITTNSQAGGGIQTIGYENLNITLVNGGEFSIQGQFKTLFDSTENYLKSFQEVFQAVNPSRASFNFGAATEALSAIIGQAQKGHEALQKALEAANAELQQIGQHRSNFGSVLDDVKEKQAHLSEQVGQAAEALANISARNEEATNLSNATSELKDRVSAYQTEFEAFQAQLDTMKQAHTTGDSQLKALIERFKNQAKSFDEMIKRSDQMLSASTVAGLASEFGTIRADLETKVTAAHKHFNWAIVFLFVSALPLILFVFAPFLVAMFPDNRNLVTAIAGMAGGQSGWHYVGQVLARFIILLPAIWYVTFCTARYNSLFKLKEH